MSASSPARAMTIFISYASASTEDKEFFELLTAHVSLLRYHYPCHHWYDSEPGAGSSITQFIEAHLKSADLVILLISADFFASKQCYEFEMKHALARRDAGEARIVSVLLRPSHWDLSPLSHFRPLPSDGKPISLWQDRDAAFTDVVQGIHQIIKEMVSQQTTLPHSIPPLAPVCDPPYTYNDLFTDRESILTAISAFFTSARTRRTSILALNGLGGIGKTAIAQEYCYHADRTYQNILWLNASSRMVLSTYISTIANQLSLPDGVRENEQQLFAAVKQWLRDQPDWLLVLDQIEDITLVDALIPPYSQGHVLLTTRLQDTRKRAFALPIPSMNINAGALFLLRRVQILPVQASLDQAPADDVHAACAIAHELDGFPLALDQAGAYLEKWGGDLTTYLILYQKQRVHLLSERGQSAEDHQESVTSTFAFAFAHLKDTIHLDLLSLLAFFYPDAIPEELLVNGAQELDEPLQALVTNPLAFHEALSELRRFSLIHSHADRTLLQIQRIVQDVLIDRLTMEQQRHIAQQMVRLLNQTFPAIRFDTRALCERYLPQAEHCATLISRYQLTLKEGAFLLERLGSFCSRRASYANAETYLLQALHLYEHHLQEEVLDTARTLNSLGLLSRRQARYKKAEVFHQQALELRERVFGPDDPKTAQSLHNLAAVHGNLGKYQDAERLYRRVLAIEERAKGSDHPDVADTLNNLGLTYSQQGRFAEAEKAYRRALAIYKRSSVADHPDLAYPLNGLGSLAEKRGTYQQAEHLYQQALAIRQHAFGEMHPEIARSITKLAGIAESQGNYQQAETLYQQALTMSEQTLGSRHPDVALILNNQALLATKQEDYPQAEVLYQRALSIYKQFLGSEHPAVASVLNNLGQLSRKTGKEERAEKLLRRALALRKKILGATHPTMAQSLGNLADVLVEQHKDEEAEHLYQQAFALYLQLPEPRHPDVAQVPEKYASLLERTNRSEEARTLRKTAGIQANK